MNSSTSLQTAIIRLQAGDFGEALRVCRSRLQLTPNCAATHHLQGLALYRLGKHQDAAAAIQHAIALDGGNPDYFGNLGTVLQSLGEVDEACRQFRQGLQLNPRMPELHFNLGNALKLGGRLHEAIVAYQQALDLRPEYPHALNNLGNSLFELGQYEDAIPCFRQALKLDPQYADAHHNLGNTLVRFEQHDESRGHFEQAARLAPQRPEFLQSYFLSLSYDNSVSEQQRYALHVRWGELVSGSISVAPHISHVADRARPLRVGYVSPDFRQHAVASFVEPILRNHDRSRFHVTCYDNLIERDETSLRLQNLADRWQPIRQLTDDAAADLIRRDEIDILVDLAGHTAHNRLGVFARKPAPVQISGWGYGWTTGLKCMDYRITDMVADPPGELERYTETLVRLKTGVHCYQPPTTEPAIDGDLQTNDREITFAAFHRHVKLNLPLLRLWADILRRLPGSRLIIKDRAFRAPHVRDRVAMMCRQGGIPQNQLTLALGSASAEEHLAAYSQAAIALDALPYNGSTTTCEALWMGVPVITRRGDTYVGRMSASLLTQVGLDDLVADSENEYVDLAVELASDPTRLRDLRRNLRAGMAESPLCDGLRYTQELERVYREIWTAWCDGTNRARRAS